MKVAVISLGCDKNTVDTEMMLGILDEAGHELVYDETEADAVVINTCSFILDAKKESIDTVLECIALKEKRLKTGSGGPCYIIVTGCLAQRYRDDIVKDLPEVDAILGVQSFDEIARTLIELDQITGRKLAAVQTEGQRTEPVDSQSDTQTVDTAEVQATETVGHESEEQAADNSAQIYGHNPVIHMAPLSEAPVSGRKRLLTTPMHYAYLKIAEGCNKACTYCSIPGFKGRYRSVPTETLVKEAEDLADRGVSELILVAQETTLYGIDLYGEKRLPKLIKSLSSIDGIKHIRLMYCYPEEITDELIELMKTEPKLYHYIDMPIQHASDPVLKRMGRRTDEASLRELIGRMRSEIPDICIRTTLIAGFPGETRADYNTLKSFIKDMRFDRLGVFAYSPEEGTPAAQMQGQVPDFFKKRRVRGLMKLQQEIAFESNSLLTDKETDVVIQGYIPEDDICVARSYRDAPDVDGCIFVETDHEYLSGTEIRVKITGSKGYDLIAEPID